jgi:hypothetical protein
MINPSASGWIDKYFFKQKTRSKLHDTLICFTLLLEKQDLYMVILSLLKQRAHNNKRLGTK